VSHERGVEIEIFLTSADKLRDGEIVCFETPFSGRPGIFVHARDKVSRWTQEPSRTLLQSWRRSTRALASFTMVSVGDRPQCDCNEPDEEAIKTRSFFQARQ
jgi:hypothetical protein